MSYVFSQLWFCPTPIDNVIYNLSPYGLSLAFVSKAAVSKAAGVHIHPYFINRLRKSTLEKVNFPTIPFTIANDPL